MNVTVTAAPLPTNWSGTPQQLLEAFLDRIEISVDGSSFVTSDTQPQGNQGPWLKNGTQWWVWDVDTSTYIPLDLSASVTNEIYIGDIANGAPDSATYSLWLQTNGSSVNGLFWYAGGTSGWVNQPRELVPGAVTLPMLAQQASGSLITFDANKNPLAVPPGGAGTFLQSTGSGIQWTDIFVVHGTPVFLTPVTLVNAATTTATWTTISGLDTYGVPSTATAVILFGSVFSNQGGGPYGVQVRPNSSGSAYDLVLQSTGSSNLHTGNQGIFPVSVTGTTVSLDYYLRAGTNIGTITLVGYIT